MDYAKYVNEKQTPQSAPIPGSAQVPNSAGGYSWAVDCWTRLDRFLVLGSEGGTYYATERKLTTDNIAAVKDCIKQDGLRAVRRIVEISDAGRAPKNDPALLALAACAKLGDADARQAAYAALPRVARIATHLFHFVEYAEAFGGWGRGMRRAVARWYDDKTVADLAYQAVKYQQRDGWSHRDLLRLAKPRRASGDRDTLYHWITTGEVAVIERYLSNGGAASGHPLATDDLKMVYALEQARVAETVRDSIRLIEEYRLPRECVRTEHLNSPEIWAALLPSMKPEALVRNLGKMSAVGLLKPMSEAEASICAKLGDAEALKRARLHPIKVLTALRIYKNGHGSRGSLSWMPSSRVLDALDAAFYLSFGAVEASGARTMLALDVSGSMSTCDIAGVEGLTPRAASAAMALVTAATEPRHCFTAFSGGMVPLSISSRQRLDDVECAISGLPFDRTDCSLPMAYARQQKLEIDAFVIYTDNETWYGNIHPAQMLREYRQKTGIDAKLVVVGMVANEFTIADPADSGMLDVVGFDAATPQLITDFARPVAQAV